MHLILNKLCKYPCVQNTFTLLKKKKKLSVVKVNEYILSDWFLGEIHEYVKKKVFGRSFLSKSNFSIQLDSIFLKSAFFVKNITWNWLIQFWWFKYVQKIKEGTECEYEFHFNSIKKKFIFNILPISGKASFVQGFRNF